MTLETYPAASPKAALVLAHGAGAGQKHPFMVRFARGMAERHISTATFDFPYITAGRKVPDRAPVLEQAWRDALAAGHAAFNPLPLFIGGKSMGGRMASHIASQGVDGVKGLVFLGYPLHPPGQLDKRRDAHLPAIVEPMLFGTGQPRRVRYGGGYHASCCHRSNTQKYTRSPAATTPSRFRAARKKTTGWRRSWTPSRHGSSPPRGTNGP